MNKPKRFFIVFGLLFLSACSSLEESAVDQDRRLAEVALTSGSPQSAIEIYRRLLEKAPDDIELQYLLGSAYNQSGEFELALHYLNQARSQESEGERGEILREAGRAKLALGQNQEALVLLLRAVQVLPHDAVSQNSLGTCYALNWQYDKARSAFVAALAIEPGSLEYRNNLALGWILDNQPQQGIDVLYGVYLRGKSTAKMRQNLALAFAMKGDIEAAKEIAKQDLTKAELDSNLSFYHQWQQEEQ